MCFLFFWLLCSVSSFQCWKSNFFCRILQHWIRLSPSEGACTHIFTCRTANRNTLSLANDLWLAKVSCHWLDFLQSENRAKRRCTSLDSSQTTWITTWSCLLWDFCPVRINLPVPALILHRFLHHIQCQIYITTLYWLFNITLHYLIISSVRCSLLTDLMTSCYFNSTCFVSICSCIVSFFFYSYFSFYIYFLFIYCSFFYLYYCSLCAAATTKCPLWGSIKGDRILTLNRVLQSPDCLSWWKRHYWCLCVHVFSRAVWRVNSKWNLHGFHARQVPDWNPSHLLRIRWCSSSFKV